MSAPKATGSETQTKASRPASALPVARIAWAPSDIETGAMPASSCMTSGRPRSRAASITPWRRSATRRAGRCRRLRPENQGGGGHVRQDARRSGPSQPRWKSRPHGRWARSAGPTVRSPAHQSRQANGGFHRYYDHRSAPPLRGGGRAVGGPDALPRRRGSW